MTVCAFLSGRLCPTNVATKVRRGICEPPTIRIHKSVDMAASNDYLAHAIECLAQVAPVSYRRIFHGIAIYHHEVQFALIVNDQLYFYTDTHSRSLYERRSMPAFQPPATQLTPFRFHQVPREILNTPAELRYWMRTAIEVAQQAEMPPLPVDSMNEEFYDPAGLYQICAG